MKIKSLSVLVLMLVATSIKAQRYNENEDLAESGSRFPDRTDLQISFSYGLAIPRAELSSSNPGAQSGFAKRGHSLKAELVYLPAHIPNQYNDRLLSLGMGVSYFNIQMPVRADLLGEQIGQAFSNRNDGTVFEPLRERWQFSSAMPGLFMNYTANRRLMFSGGAMFGHVFIKSPEYTADQGNFIPDDYAYFFRQSWLNNRDATSLRMRGWAYKTQLAYLLTPRVGMGLSMEVLNARLRVNSEIFEVRPNGTRFEVERRLIERQQPLRVMHLGVNLFLNVGHSSAKSQTDQGW